MWLLSKFKNVKCLTVILFILVMAWQYLYDSIFIWRDFLSRMTSYGIEISRPPQKIGRYKMVQTGHHAVSKQDPNM